MDQQALVRKRARFEIALRPSWAADPLGGVRAMLYPGLLRWNSFLGGAVLCYSNEEIVSAQADIHPFFPYLQVTSMADVIVFAVQPGFTITGKVQHASMEMLSIIVLGYFNAVIHNEHIRNDFKFDEEDACWRSQSNPKHKIAIGTQLAFKVLTLQHSEGFFSMRGSLADEGTGAHGHVPGTRFLKKSKTGAAASPQPLTEPPAAGQAAVTAQLQRLEPEVKVLCPPEHAQGPAPASTPAPLTNGGYTPDRLHAGEPGATVWPSRANSPAVAEPASQGAVRGAKKGPLEQQHAARKKKKKRNKINVSEQDAAAAGETVLLQQGVEAAQLQQSSAGALHKQHAKVLTAPRASRPHEAGQCASKDKKPKRKRIVGQRDELPVSSADKNELQAKPSREGQAQNGSAIAAARTEPPNKRAKGNK